MKKVESILFVCLGNICRSPLAEGIARKLNADYNLGLKLDSAGTGSWHIGKPPCEGSIKVANMNGVDISGLRARQVKIDDNNAFDLILAMDNSNYNDLIALGFDESKLHKLGDFGWDGNDVPDPYYFSDFEGFERVYEMVSKCTLNFFRNHLLSEHSKETC